jgi:hypothetical protein
MSLPPSRKISCYKSLARAKVRKRARARKRAQAKNSANWPRRKR